MRIQGRRFAEQPKRCMGWGHTKYKRGASNGGALRGWAEVKDPGDKIMVAVLETAWQF